MARRARGSDVWRRKAYQILDYGIGGDRQSILLHRFLIFLIILNVTSVILESVPDLAASFGRLFKVIEVVSVAVFTVEYLARLWVAPEHKPLSDLAPWKARIVHAFSLGMIVDLLAIMPFFLVFLGDVDLRFVLLLRLLRFFKIARYSTGMRSLVDALYTERNALVACGVILVGLVVVSASFMHLVERDVQPEKFGTIPDAMYWSVITLTTVGYGDVVPVTAAGKLLASVTAIFGLGMLALPVGILATAFSEVIHRRDFVVTWGMVARVPLFQGLDAETIAEIMRFLRSQTAQPGQVIVKKGETANSMYFIAAGEVVVEVPGEHVRLSVGDFFGEVALLGHVQRTATVRARLRTNLLVLDKGDVQALMERRPDVGERIEEVARVRVPRESLRKGGDIISDEIRHHEPKT